MKLTTKFSVGDWVYPISRESRPVKKPCGFCDARGRITGSDGSDRSCPECYGQRGHTTWQPERYQIPHDNPILHIGQVRVTFDEKGQREQYMAHETGIDSGMLWPGAALFATKEEALAECARLNAQEDCPLHEGMDKVFACAGCERSDNQ